MPARRQLDLSTFDGKLFDGLNFCRKVYDLFEQLRNGTDGIAVLRLRRDEVSRLLIQELIPIARYVQTRYREGRRIRVRWVKRQKQYDAILCSSGALVENNSVPRRVFVEVTTAVHAKDHLARKELHERGYSSGAKGIMPRTKSGEVLSTPYVESDSQLVCDLAEQITERVTTKAGKGYPQRTVLIINCVTDCPLFLNNWNDVVERVTGTEGLNAFLEVFLVESNWTHSTTLYRTG